MQQSTTESGDVGAARAGDFSAAYRWYVLGLLFVVYIFNFIDRQILGILAQPIKEDLGLSDTQLGFMGGVAFAIFYTFVGIPIARLADRGIRRDILAGCLALWSAMTVLCGFAVGFVSLLLCRIGVAIGEAGGSPPSHSIISDMFRRNRRATALGIYALGIPIGTMLGNLLGGVINDAFDWRTAFIVVGTPGIVLALIVRVTLREPRRGMSEAVAIEPQGEPLPLTVVFKALWDRRSFRYLSLGAALHAFVGYGVGYWIPAFFIRSHDFTTTEIGTALFWLGVPGIVGTFLGGYLGDRLARRDVRWYVWLPGIATLLSVPFACYVYLHSAPWFALWIYAVPIFFHGFYLGPTFSLTQGLVGLRMRALAASILLFVVNLVGLGLGPQFVGIVSDLLQADYGRESLRIALVAVLVFNVLSTYLYFLAGRDLERDLVRSHELR